MEMEHARLLAKGEAIYELSDTATACTTWSKNIEGVVAVPPSAFAKKGNHLVKKRSMISFKDGLCWQSESHLFLVLLCRLLKNNSRYNLWLKINRLWICDFLGNWGKLWRLFEEILSKPLHWMGFKIFDLGFTWFAKSYKVLGVRGNFTSYFGLESRKKWQGKQNSNHCTKFLVFRKLSCRR